MVKELFESHDLLLGSYSQWRETICRMGVEHALQYPGFCVRMEGCEPITFYDDSQSPEEQEFTLAHELGHILMGHLTDRPGYFSEESEHTANVFGAVMLALSLYDEYKKMEV